MSNPIQVRPRPSATGSEFAVRDRPASCGGIDQPSMNIGSIGASVTHDGSSSGYLGYTRAALCRRAALGCRMMLIDIDNDRPIDQIAYRNEFDVLRSRLSGRDIGSRTYFRLGA
jgi:hypothetical protein